MRVNYSPTPIETFQEHLLEISHLIETKIGHELSLINHRISWLATSQAFLFVAVATLLTTITSHTHLAIIAFLFCIPSAGLLLCYQVGLSVNAAFTVLERDLMVERKDLTTQINQLFNTRLAALGPDRITDFKGARAAKSIPYIFMGSWVVVLALLVWLVRFPA